jgi:hypothetical protein
MALSKNESDQQPVLNVAPATGGLRQAGVILLNLWLAFHLFAIVICPASAEPASPLAQWGFEIVSPYLHTLYLDHGFRFFAPEPGGSTLVSYTLEFADGSTRSGQIPDRSMTPRLFYHRHFMVTEFLGNGPEELEPLVERAIARNLLRESSAIRVTLNRRSHDTASVDEIRRGLSLNDESLFKELPLGSFTLDELQSPVKSSRKHPVEESKDEVPDESPVEMERGP